MMIMYESLKKIILIVITMYHHYKENCMCRKYTYEPTKYIIQILLMGSYKEYLDLSGVEGLSVFL